MNYDGINSEALSINITLPSFIFDKKGNSVHKLSLHRPYRSMNFGYIQEIDQNKWEQLDVN
jgi:hypothetical protein